MSMTFTDDDLQSWEAFATGGNYGLATRPKVVFNCVSDPRRRPRYVELGGDEADAEELVFDGGVERMRELLKQSKELE